ncbi:MAG: DivIVA domain-containing protein [Actinomycetota bacterium]
MKRNQTQRDGAAEFSAPAPAPSAASKMLTPLDIQQKEFRVSTRGYKMRDVDEFLDQITDAMSAVIAENERLRAGGPGGPGIGTADLDDTNRQADEIIKRARDEAGRIMDSARAEAVTAGAAAGAGSAAERAAVHAFLAKEREFLQGLAGLVQGHAESVKGMAKAARQAPVAAVPSDAPPARGQVASDPAPSSPIASAPPATSVPSPTEPAAAAPPEPAAPGTEEPLRLEEPEPASIGRSEGDEPIEGDRSLRELFWGED